MTRRTLALSLLLLCSVARAEIIPAARKTDWTPGTITGVPGGIPTRETIYQNIVTDGGADPTGGVDASTIISDTIHNCPDNQVVYMPAGTYKISTRIRPNSGSPTLVTLRGAGMGQTILKPVLSGFSGGSVFDFGPYDYPGPTYGPYTITAGATKNSTTITIADTTDISVGGLIKIHGAGSVGPTWIHPLKDSGSPGPGPDPVDTARWLAWMHRVVSKTGTTITFTPPLPMDISMWSPEVDHYSLGCAVGVGFENFTIDMQDMAAPSTVPFSIGQAWGCWVKGVEIKDYSHGKAMIIGRATSCEFRRNYLHGGSTGSGGEGFDFANSSCWNLIEDNIIYNGGDIVFNDAGDFCSGNVASYNFSYAHVTADATLSGFDTFAHGTGNSFNLYEGNVMGMLVGGDGYFGSYSHGTIFRNWITATHPVAVIGLRGIVLKHFNAYWNIVGNVIGTSAFPTTNNAPADFEAGHGGFYEVTTKAYSGGNQYAGLGPAQTIYELGYPNIGNTNYDGTITATSPPDYTAQSNSNTQSPMPPRDLNVQASASRHGNYDFFNQAQVWETTDTNVTDHTDHTIPNSLLYNSRPAWMNPATPWPPINPASVANTNSFTTTSGDPEDMPIDAVQAYYDRDMDGIPIWWDELEPAQPVLYLFRN